MVNEVIFNSVFSNFTSYGITGINTLIALNKNLVKTMAVPISDKVDYFHNQPISESLEAGKTYNKYAPCIRLYHQFSLNYQVGRGEFIGWPIFETTLFSPEEKHQLLQLDKIFVCSKWAKDIIEENGIDIPTFIIPLGVDINTFYPEDPREDVFRFFFPGKFEYRKSFEIVMEVFEKAFSVNDNIEILFLPTNFFIGDGNQEWAKLLMSSKLASKVRIIGRLNSHEEVAKLYNYSDCVVSFSKAEGFNLPLLEALACGRYVISPNYSAPTEFLNNENALLVDMPDREIAVDGVFFDGKKGVWGKHTEQTKTDLANCLRVAYERGKGINHAGVETAKKFTWDNSAKQIIEALDSYGLK